MDYFEEGPTRCSHTSPTISQSTCCRRSGISTVGGANRLLAGLSGIRIAVGSRFFLLPKSPDRVLGPNQLLYNEYRVFSPGVKRAKSKHSYLHLVTWLRMSAAVFQLLLDIFVALTGETLLLHYVVSCPIVVRASDLAFRRKVLLVGYIAPDADNTC